MHYLKNPKTGVIYPENSLGLLKKMRPEYIPCDKNGRPTYAEGQAIVLEKRDFLLNPVTGDVTAFSDALASMPGMIPVDSAAHATAIMVSLGGEPLVVTDGDIPAPDGQVNPTDQGDLNAPPVPDETPDAFADVDLDAMTKDDLEAFAREHFGEELDKREKREVLIEKVQVMINTHQAAA